MLMNNLRKIHTLIKRWIYHLSFGIIASILILSTILISLNLSKPSVSAQTPPTTPTLSNVCGVANPSNIEASSSTPVAPTTAISKIIVPSSNLGMAAFHLINVGGTEEAYILTDNNQSRSIYVYNLSTGALITSFPVAISGNSQDSFAVDSSGNVYVLDNINTQDLYKYNSTGTIVWQVSTPAGSSGAYGYTNSSGVFLIAFLAPGSTTGPAYNQTGQSTVYNQSGVLQPNNNMDIAGYATQDPTTGDILSFNTSSGGMFRVYTNSGTLKFQMGTDLSGGTKGPWHFNNLMGGLENPAGGYFISDDGVGMDSFSSTGAYQGMAPDFQSQNGAVNTIGVNPGQAEIYNGQIYYYLNGGINSFDSANNSPGIYSISLSNLNADINYPQGSNGHLGIGAGMYTSNTNNYFPNGSSPSVSMKFYPWWGPQATNFEIQYSVYSIPQYYNGVNVTPSSFSLGNYLNSSSTSPVTIPLNLGTNITPGAYEISAKIFNTSNLNTPIGADCLDYSVGNSNDIYSPSTFSSMGVNEQEVEIAHEQGQNYVRGANAALIDTCLPGVTTPTSSTVLNCPSSVVSDVNAAQTLANQYGITFAPEIAQTGSTLDQNLVSSGQWGRLVGSLASQFSSVNHWLLWNEINGDGGNYVTGSWDATNVFEPAYTAIKAVSSSDQVIAGSTLEPSIPFWQSVGTAGGFKYMDAIDIHPYTDYNKSFEEQGMVIPPQNAAPSEATNLGILDQLKAVTSDTAAYAFNSGVTSLPINDSEFGIWNNPTISFYSQANKIIRGLVLQTSIGINNVSVFESNIQSACYSVNGETWGTVGCGFDGGDNPSVLAQSTYQYMINGSTVAGNRHFLNWINTGVPHTYAALYGPSGTNNNDIAVVWADDFNTSIIPTLSGGGTINITGQYGESSSVSSNSALNINGIVQYLSIPSGQTLSIKSPETFARNLALASSGASVVASSTAVCGSLNPINVLNGVDDLSNGGRCGASAFWAQSYSDNNPSLTVTLNAPTTIDRLFLSSSGIDSVATGLRNFNVAVSSTVGGTFNTVGTISNNFFQRNYMFNFTSQTVAQIEITGMVPNYSGYGNGLPPIFWPTNATTVNDDTNPWYGQDNIYDIEAYAPGSNNLNTNPPTISITSPSNGSYAHVSVPIVANVTDNSGTGIARVEYFINGVLAQTITSAPYTYNWNTLLVNNGTYTVEVEAFDNSGNSSSTTESLTVNNGDINNDGIVNIYDLSILAKNWGATNATYSNGDLNGDKAVNIYDLSILAKNWQ